jgi:hypothetical protein
LAKTLAELHQHQQGIYVIMRLHEKHPTVDFLVYEEPEIDTEETPIIIWKAIKFTIADINLEVTAIFTIPENGNIAQLNQKAFDTWIFTNSLPHLSTITEKENIGNFYYKE